VFEGNKGKAMWHYQAVGNLTIDSFNGHNIVISRADPPGTYSSTWAMPDGYFGAKYTGVVQGNHIEGRVFWNENESNSGTWSATIQNGVCEAGQTCPITTDQILYLGLLSYGDQLYLRAFDCFLFAAKKGNPRGQGLLASLIYEMKGDNSIKTSGFKLAKASADGGSAFGMETLGKMYRDGVGTPKDPAQANYWLGQAAKLKAQQLAEINSQGQATNTATSLSGAGVYGIILGAILQAGRDSWYAPPKEENRRRECAAQTAGCHICTCYPD
jgi:hypothetical protein